jgi:ABC-type Co2+ transport system permease subunit
MHIEPGVVDGAKMLLSVGTATVCGGAALALAADELRASRAPSFLLRAALAAVGTLVCFELLPHFVAGVSEVHLILGTTLLLLLGAGAAALGLVGGLLLQGLLFAPTDLPMFTVNATTLLCPLLAVSVLARRAIRKPYVELGYRELLKLSALFQGGIVAWVAFWVLYGQGLAALGDLARFAGAYSGVLLLEPVVDVAVLATARGLRRHAGQGVFTHRLFHAA